MLSSVTFTVDLAKSMRKGVGCQTSQPVTVEFDPAQLPREDRELIASRLDDKARVVGRSEENGHFYSNRLVVSASPRVEDLVQAIRDEDAAVASFKTRKEQRDAEQLAKQIEEDRIKLNEPHTARMTVYLWLTDTGVILESDRSPSREYDKNVVAHESFSYVKKWLPHLHTQQVRDSDGAKFVAVALEEQSKAAKQVAEFPARAILERVAKDRLQWVTDHGSPRLKRLVAEGMGNANRWLGDTLAGLLTPVQRDRWLSVKVRAEAREYAEAKIPKHLLYTKGWPTCIPTVEEATLLGAVRFAVADAVGFEPTFIRAEDIISRYTQLMRLKDAKPKKRVS